MKKFYDDNKGALVFLDSEASPSYWDKHWFKSDLKKIFSSRSVTWVARESAKHLLPASRILEGGCGNCIHVSSLHREGFEVVGVDFAEETVRCVNESAPQLNVEFGDVRALRFEDQSFDGYWSLGVIEHFWDGFEDIAKEMHRVLRGDGKGFITFPAISPFRRLKVRLGFYDKASFLRKPNGFYQFALDPASVISNFEALGFRPVKKRFMGGFKGMKDECGYLGGWLSLVNRSNSIFAKVLIKLIDFLASSFFGHVCYLVVEKK